MLVKSTARFPALARGLHLARLSVSKHLGASYPEVGPALGMLEYTRRLGAESWK